MPTHQLHRRFGRPWIAVLLVAGVCLSGCSSASSAPQAATGAPASASVPESPPAQTVKLGTEAVLPADTVRVSRVLDPAAPQARKPDAPASHWASATVSQCATGQSRQGGWELALADGTTASEPSSWIEGDLPRQLQPSEEQLGAGDCVSGDVYFVVPDGADVTGAVLESRSANPVRPQVTWTVD